MLFAGESLDDLSVVAVIPGTGEDFQYTIASGGFYMKCPKCGARNGFRVVEAADGGGVRMVLASLLD